MPGWRSGLPISASSHAGLKALTAEDAEVVYIKGFLRDLRILCGEEIIR